MPLLAPWALAGLFVAWGPPALPPLPGERPAEEPAEEPAEPTPPPKTSPSPLKPFPAPEREPTTPPPAATPEPTPPKSDWSPPQFVEPPQPNDEGRTPEAPAPSTDEGREPRPARGGPGSAPSMKPDLLPGEVDEEPAMLRMPPPRRPPYSGLGLFIGAGVTFSAALAEQIVAHVLVKRRCIDPFTTTEPDPMDPEAEGEVDYEAALLSCAPGVLPAIALRVHSDLGLLATIGLATAGASLRGQRDAYDDVFADRPARAMLGLRAAGIGLVSAGVVTWFTTGAASWGLLASCRDAKCATRARLMSFTTRDTAMVLIAAGGGMLGYTVAHRRAYDRFFRDRAMSVGTAWLPGGAGLSLSGRF